MITAAFKTLRNAGKTATGLNFVMMNLQGLDEDGNAVDGLTAKYQELFDTYTKGQVKITDSNGTLRSSWDILDDLSEVWDTLGKNVQAYIAQEVAGKRQAKILLALMSNWETAKAALQSGLDSESSAEKENLAYVDSINGKINQLKSSWRQLAQTTISPDDIKGFVSLLTNVVDLLNKIGGLSPVLGVVVGLMMSFKSTAITQFVAGLGGGFQKLWKNLTNATKGLYANLTAQQQSILATLQATAATANETLAKERNTLTTLKQQARQAGANATEEQYAAIKLQQIAVDNAETNAKKANTAATQYATVATKGFGVALSTILSWIGLAITAFSLISAAINAYKQAQNEAATASVEAGNKIQEQAKQVDALYQAYVKYYNLAGGDNTDKDMLEAKTALCNKIKDQIGALKGLTQGEKAYQDAVAGLSNEDIFEGYKKSQKQTFDELSKNIDGYVYKVQQATGRIGWFGEYQNILDTSGMLDYSLSGRIGQSEDYQKDWDIINRYVSSTRVGDSLNYTINGDDFVSQYENMIKLRQELDDANLTSSSVYNDISEQLSKSSEAYQEYINQLSQLKLSEYISSDSFKMPETEEDLDKITQEIKAKLSSTGEYSEQTVQSVVDNIGGSLTDFRTLFQTVINDSNTLTTDELKTLKEGVSSTISTIKTLSSAMKEMSENGELSAETAIKLIDAGYAEALSYDKNTGAIKLNNEALKKLYRTKLDAQKIDAKNKLDEATEGVKDQIENFDGLVQTYGNATKAVEEYLNSLSDSDRASLMENEFFNTWVQANNLVQVLNTLLGTSNNDIFGGFVDELSNVKTLAQDATSALDKLSSALEEQNENGSISWKTALDLIDAGYATVLSFDNETGAIRVNEQACKDLALTKANLALAEAKLQRNETKKKLEAEAKAVGLTTEAYIAQAKAKMASAAVDEATKTKVESHTTTSQRTRMKENRLAKNRMAVYESTEDHLYNTDYSKDESTTKEVTVTETLKTYLDENALVDTMTKYTQFLEQYGIQYDSGTATDGDANEEKAEQDYYKTLADEASARQSAYDKMYDAERMTIEDYYNAIADLQSDGMFDVIKSMSSDELKSLLSLTDSKFSGLKSLAEEYIDLTKKLDELSVDKLTESYEKLTDQIAKYGDLIANLGDIDTPEERSAQASYLASQYELICGDIIDLNKQLQETDLSLEKQKIIQKQINELTKQKVDIEDQIKDMARDYLEQEKENKLLAVEIAQKTKLLNLEKEIYGDQGKTGYEHQKQQEIDAIQKQIDALNEQKDAQDRVNEGKELEAKLTQLQLDLVNEMNNKTTKVLTRQADGSWQFEYSANLEKIKEIQENINETKKEQLEYDFDSEIQKLEDKIKALEDEKEQKSNAYEDIKYYIDLQAEQDKARIESEYALIDTKVEEIYNSIMDSSNALSEELAKLAQSYNDALNQNEQLTALEKSNDLVASKLNDLDVWFKQLVDTDTTNAQEMIDAYNSVTEETLEPINDSIDDIIDSANDILNQLSSGNLSTKIDVSGITGLDILSSSEKFDSLVDYIKGQSELGLLGSTINISKIEFPNVQSDIKEIQNAILDLPNVAIQRAKQQ